MSESVTTHLRSLLVCPPGLDPETEEGADDARHFGVTVEWAGPYRGRSGGGWAVRNGASELSRSGSWTFSVPRFRRWQHRWEAYEEALAAAIEAVPDVRTGRWTYAEWVGERDARRAISASSVRTDLG